MARYGFKGTYYINSGRFGQANYLTAAQAMGLQNEGHEIAGHTVSHADLPTLDAGEQARQICNDRTALLNQGLQVTDFAYPYGDTNSSVESVVQSCGYNSARGIGNIVSPGTCTGCAYAESIPPADPMHIATPDSIKPETTLEDMENYVLQAQQHGGGWVPLVIHHVCDSCDPSNLPPYTVASSTLDNFFAWLSNQQTNHVSVKTVAQVIGGSLQPAVQGPPPPPPSDLDNLLRNSSMEVDSNKDGTPDCFQRAGYGTNTAAWSNRTDAHSGTNSIRVDISSFTDGDRRILTAQDLGACAPPAKPGHTYEFSGWYKLTGGSRAVAYYRNANGGWSFFAQSPVLATSDTYRQVQWTTPALPNGATALSIGISLRSVGYVQADDFALHDSDVTAPTVRITSPDDGVRVRDTVNLTADASDDKGIDHLDFLVDGSVACTTTTSPYSCAWDTTRSPDHVAAVTVRAVDTAGNVTLSEGRNYTVSNSVPVDTTPPVVDLTAPTDGQTVQGGVTLTANASDDDAVSQVLFLVGDHQVGSAGSAPYSMVWDSSTVPDGQVAMTVEALDRSGNLASSTPITVTVNNNSLDTVAPTSSATCNSAACSTAWYRQSVNVGLTATDDASGVAGIRYTTDGTDPSPTAGQAYTAPLTISSPTTLKWLSYDAAGNAEAVQTLVLNVDVVAPTVVISGPADGSTVTGTTYIKATPSDDVGVARVWFYLDGKLLGSRIVSPWQWKWDTTTTTKGSHQLKVVAGDAAGNQSTAAQVQVTVA